jgi:hypothetical protein
MNLDQLISSESKSGHIRNECSREGCWDPGELRLVAPFYENQGRTSETAIISKELAN